MSNKRLPTLIGLALFGVLTLASMSVGALRTPATPFGGCFSPCTDDTQCINPKCSACNGTCRNVPSLKR